MTDTGASSAVSFTDNYIDQDPCKSLEELTKAMEEKPDDAECFCQRAYAHILLRNYNDAVLDAKRSLELQPNNVNAFLRKGEAEFHLQNYTSAEDTFKQGQKLNLSDSTFSVWIKKCEEKLNASSQVEESANLQTSSKYRYDWYQTESHVIINLMIKNVPKSDVHVQFSEREIEIKMKKTEAMWWEKLEGQEQSLLKHFTADSLHKYPSSSHYTKNWDKLVVEIKEEEKNEKVEGDAALNKLFQQIYTDGSDEVKRAMNKSFMESGGTVLSTNWTDVGKRKVDVNPPDDMEWKKF
ncbi:SGT1 homolog [Pelobates cultripes]|uniref:SGT1 homolog n=1 Tax=Pelobates cultripes TaxID=61616 RepID=A0AAD1R576_PELCU|nr:SGT1 homolog [Pelobates cultripes]